MEPLAPRDAVRCTPDVRDVSYIPSRSSSALAAAQFFGSPLRSIVKVNVAMVVEYLVAGGLLSGALIAYTAMFR